MQQQQQQQQQQHNRGQCCSRPPRIGPRKRRMLSSSSSPPFSLSTVLAVGLAWGLLLPRMIDAAANTTLIDSNFTTITTNLSSSSSSSSSSSPGLAFPEQQADVDIATLEYQQQEEPAFDETAFSHNYFSLSNIGVMMIAALALLLLAPGSGMSVGGILVPLFSQFLFSVPNHTDDDAVFGFFLEQSKQHAVALSNITLAGSAAASCLAIMLLSSTSRCRRSRRRRQHHGRRHRLLERQRPLIDWEWIGLVEPMTLAGVVMGTRLTTIVADEFIRGTIILVYTVLAGTMLQRAITVYCQNNNNNNNNKTQTIIPCQHEHGWVPVSTTEDGVELATGSAHHHHLPRRQLQQHFKTHGTAILQSDDDDDDDDDIHLDAHDLVAHRVKNRLLEHILEQEKMPNAKNILSVVLLFGLVLFVNIIVKGDPALVVVVAAAATAGSGQDTVPCESPTFWLADVLIILVAVILTLRARKRILEMAQRKHLAGYPYLETDIQWDEQSTLVYPAICTLGGVMAAICGVGGGGMIKAPLMLALGVPPAVAAATSTTMLLFTSLTASLSFWMYGMLLTDYAVVYFLMAFAATYIGQVLFMQKNTSYSTESSSSAYIVYCIAIVVVLSAISLGIEWILTVRQGEQNLPYHYYYTLCTNVT